MKTRRILLVAVVLGALTVVSSALATQSTHVRKATTIVTTRKTSLGTILVTGSGRTLYRDKADRKGHPACTGACLGIWPPLKANGTLRAEGKAKQSALGWVKIAGGVKQVTYDGHPLYRFDSDSKSGETSGQGVAGFYVVSPSGALITK